MFATLWTACKVAFIQDPAYSKPSMAVSAVGSWAQSLVTDWHQVVFSDESCFNLWDHDGQTHVKCYAGQHCLPECIIERQCGQIPGVMFWGAISYHGWSNLLWIKGNLNSNRYIREVLQSELISFFQGIPGTIFQKDNACLHVAKTVWDFYSNQHMQLFPWPTYSPDMLLIEYAWDLIDKVSSSWSVSCSFKRQTLAAHTSPSTSRHPKSVSLHTTLHSSTYCSPW